VSFGEDQTTAILRRDPSQAPHLLGLSLVSLAIVRRLARWTGRRYGDHPVLSQMPGFLRATAGAAELRLRRMGVLRRPLAGFPTGERAAMMTAAVARRYGRTLNPFRSKPDPLTETYLRDPTVRRRLADAAARVR
jgi:hypothetical protein